MVGSFQPIVATPGDDVILPCHVEPQVNVAGLTVEWSKPDLKPDPNDRLSRVEYVHVYRDSREVLDMKLSSYISRTALFTDGLRQGNISLKIINVTLADEGRYRCYIPKLKSRRQSSIVRLVIDPNSSKTWTTETPLHPRSLQTSDPKKEADVEGGLTRWNRLVPVAVVFCFFLLMVVVVIVTGYLTKKGTSGNSNRKQHCPLFSTGSL